MISPYSMRLKYFARMPLVLESISCSVFMAVLLRAQEMKKN